uniref:Putative secreted protein n=1 Tax=Ixodes ricinus TaxID=34613 RepID=A0A6B0U2Y9_IXORI
MLLFFIFLRTCVKTCVGLSVAGRVREKFDSSWLSFWQLYHFFPCPRIQVCQGNCTQSHLTLDGGRPYEPL